MSQTTMDIPIDVTPEDEARIKAKYGDALREIEEAAAKEARRAGAVAARKGRLIRIAKEDVLYISLWFAIILGIGHGDRDRNWPIEPFLIVFLCVFTELSLSFLCSYFYRFRIHRSLVMGAKKIFLSFLGVFVLSNVACVFLAYLVEIVSPDVYASIVFRLWRFGGTLCMKLYLHYHVCKIE